MLPLIIFIIFFLLCLLSKNVKIKKYRAVISPVVFYEYEASYITLKEEHSLRVFENRVLRRIFGPKREEVSEDFIVRSFIIHAPQIFLG
jgi:hypothetical protein